MNRIKELLARNGLKVKWIAEQIGCHPTEVSNWISGRRTPSLQRAIKIAKILGCSEEELFPTTEQQKGVIKNENEKSSVQKERERVIAG